MATGIKPGAPLSAPEAVDAQARLISTAFGRVLNAHGHGFQYAVLERARTLLETRQSQWGFEAAELPVTLQGNGTRIDFLLKRRGGAFYMVAECKRSNPALAEWCFVRAPFARRNDPSPSAIVIEKLVRYPETDVGILSEAYTWTTTSDFYHVAHEVRSSATGEGHTGRGAIEEAVSQALRGSNGLVEFFARKPETLEPLTPVFILPVVFTTARLWISDADLGTTDLISGNIDLAERGFAQRDFVAYQYHLSPGIRHSARAARQRTAISDILGEEFSRTVFIVSAAGVDRFLRWSSDI